MPRQKRPPERQFYLLEGIPPQAEGRERNWLGVAFEIPEQPANGEFTPQGDYSQQDASQPSDDVKAADSVVAETQPIRYNSLGTWPRFIGSKEDHSLYSDKCTTVLGFEAIEKRLAKINTGLTVTEIIAGAFGLERGSETKLEIPFMRIWTMESAFGKIRSLLEEPEYRWRLIDMCKRKGLEKVYIAVGIAAGQNMTLSTAKTRGLRLGADVADQTGTIPVSFNNELYLMKEDHLKSTLPDDMIVSMAYRVVHVVRIKNPAMMQRFRKWWDYFRGASMDLSETDDLKTMKDYGISADKVSYNDGSAKIEFIIEGFNSKPRRAFMGDTETEAGEHLQSCNPADSATDEDHGGNTFENIVFVRKDRDDESETERDDGNKPGEKNEKGEGKTVCKDKDDDESYEDTMSRLLHQFHDKKL